MMGLSTAHILADGDLGWSALAVAIIAGVDMDEAFERLDRPPKNNQPYRRTTRGRDVLQSDETQLMAKMRKKGRTYDQIGEMFGVSKWAVYNRLRRLNEAI